MMVKLLIILNMARANYLKMVINIKECLIKIKKKDMDNINIKMEIYLKDILKMIWSLKE